MHAVDRENTIVTHDSGSPREQMVAFWECLFPGGYLGWGKTTQLGHGLGFSLPSSLFPCPLPPFPSPSSSPPSPPPPPPPPLPPPSYRRILVTEGVRRQRLELAI